MTSEGWRSQHFLGALMRMRYGRRDSNREMQMVYRGPREMHRSERAAQRSGRHGDESGRRGAKPRSRVN